MPILFTPVADPVYVHPLSTALKYSDNIISEIAIRKPTGRDLLMIGSPVLADPTSGKDAKIDFPVAYQMAAALSGIPEKILYDADPAELVELFWKIATFFIPGWQHILPAMKTFKESSSAPQGQPVS